MTTRDETTTIALIKKDLEYLKQGVSDIKTELKCQNSVYVSKVEFGLVSAEQTKRIDRVERLVYGAIALTLTSIGKALLDLVISAKASGP